MHKPTPDDPTVPSSAPTGAVLAPRAFVNRTGEELRRALRYGRSLSLMLVSLDQMPQLRAGLGEEAVDGLVDLAARSIKRHMRESDYLGRCEGEAFGVLLPETSPTRAATLAERLVAELRAMSDTCAQDVGRLTASVGVSCLNPRLSDPEGLIQAADIQLCRAQREGGNCIAVEASVKLNPTAANNGRVH